jgi:hypothetical protein
MREQQEVPGDVRDETPRFIGIFNRISSQRAVHKRKRYDLQTPCAREITDLFSGRSSWRCDSIHEILEGGCTPLVRVRVQVRKRQEKWTRRTWLEWFASSFRLNSHSRSTDMRPLLGGFPRRERAIRGDPAADAAALNVAAAAAANERGDSAKRSSSRNTSPWTLLWTLLMLFSLSDLGVGVNSDILVGVTGGVSEIESPNKPRCPMDSELTESAEPMPEADPR